MRSGQPSREDGTQRPWRLLLWTTLAAILFGLIQFGEIAEDALRVARNNAHPGKASGDIVFVGVDDKSLSTVGRWPWGRDVQGRMVAQADAAGASAVFLDILYASPSTPREDAAFEDAIRRSGKVTLADRYLHGPNFGSERPTRPLARFTRWANTALISAPYNYQGAVMKLPRVISADGKTLPGFALAMSGRPIREGANYRIDYSISPFSVPYVSASDLIAGRSPVDLKGKTVIVGLAADQLGDQYWLPGTGKMPGALVQILGAETLKRGNPVELGWWPALFFALVFAMAAVHRPTGLQQAGVVVCGLALLLGAPVFLERSLIFAEITPALFALLIVGGRLFQLNWRRRGLVNAESGLPNLTALKSIKASSDRALVVARIHNQSELRAALTEQELRDATVQLIARLNASGDAKLFQGEDGTFAWLMKKESAFGNHLEALHAMFRTPIVLSGRQLDVALSFGVELGTGRSVANRIASAILAADEAWADGLRWKLHDPSRQEEVNWRVSLLGELDQAIDNGEVWLAYQPQYDITHGRIVGAEALARWTHPQKGPISPTEFIAAAETNGRIAKLTDFVLDRAIASAAAINRRGVEFIVAVNLSARLLTDRELLGRVKHMLATHGLPPERLTLELTETATLQDADSGLATLDELRAMGIRVAIDDYGTGLSTLDYLKKVPANEIKIDQSFIKSMRVNRSDLIMVQSTIALAHSLGRTVVAEGVEDRQSLDELARMGCDVAQGFAIGRPMGVRELIQRLQIRSTRRVA